MRSGTGATGTAALLLAIATGACAGHLPPCPAAGGPAWTELEGAHFRLRTDGNPANGRAALDDLEQFQAALLTIFGAPAGFDTGHLPVILVERGWDDFAPPEAAGYFTRALFQPLIVMPAGGDWFRQTVIKHELVHYFSRMVMPEQPPWLSEGLATYYQTIQYDARDGRVTVGTPLIGLVRIAQRNSAAHFAQVFTAKGVWTDSDRFYATAWIAVHYLVNHRATAFAGYVKALHDGATPEAAWTAAFGAQTPASLGADVQNYAYGGQYELLRYRFTPPKPAMSAERRLSDAETHATRALLYLSGMELPRHASDEAPVIENPRPEAKAEVAEALRLDPDHVAARAIAHFMFGAPVDFDQAKLASQKHADDWMAWLLLAEASHGPAGDGDQNDALVRATDIASRDRSVRIPDPAEKK